MKRKVTLLNIISSLLLQICSVISGFIIPKIILNYFGSSTNGLVTSLNQLLSYVAIIEGGVTGVIVANLYKPLIEKDEGKLSSVLVTAKRFYNKVGFIFIVYSLIVGLIYPYIFKLDFFSTFLLTVILSINLLIQYMFSLTLKTILSADKKVYIVSFSQIIITISNIILAFVSVKIYPNIHLLKLISGVLYLVQPIVYGIFIRKHYKINWKAVPDNNLIKERWNGFAINIAAFIHNSTDAVVLTIFTDFKTVSIYSVYVLVTAGLKRLIEAVTNGINPTVGQAYAKEDLKELHQKLDLYEYIVFILVFFLFTLAGLLITPFVTLYTKGVTDTNYYQPLFGVLIVIAEALYLLKYPHLNLAYSANKFKEISKPAYIEAIINIVLSVVLVNFFGLIGVAIGTICAMIFRMGFHVYFTSKIVKDRKQIIFYKKLLLFSIVTFLGVAICLWLFPITEVSVILWIIRAVEYAMVLGMLYFVISWLFFKKEMNYFKLYLFRK